MCLDRLSHHTEQMVMSDDPFFDPATLADTEEFENGITARAFFTVVLGLPLAVWGGYSLLREYLGEEPNTTPRAMPRSTRKARSRADPEALELGTVCVYSETGESITVTKVHRSNNMPYYYTVQLASGAELHATRDQITLLDPASDETESVVQEGESGGEVGEVGEVVDGESGVEGGDEGGDGDGQPANVRPPTPIHPEIKYASSVELTEYRKGAEPGPQSAFVIEATPAGLIAMGYEFGEKRWIYWANQTPHFRVLDTVARVYSNTHNRHPLYIPPAVADAANEADEKAAASVDGASSGAEPDGEQIAADAKASLFITPTPVGAAELPRPEKKHIANCFKRMGMLSELRFIEDGPRDAPKRTSYADFMNKTRDR